MPRLSTDYERALVEDPVGFLMPIILGVLGSVMFLGHMVSEVWDYTYKRYHESSQRIIPRLEAALAARGVPFAVRIRGKRSLLKIRIDEFIDLDRGVVTIAVAPEGETTRVFLGPLENDNRVAIERLQDLIDDAVGVSGARGAQACSPL